MAKKFLAGEVGFLDALGCEFAYNLGFGRNRGVVRTGHPKSIFALHTRTAHQNILYRIIEHMTHMEHAGNIWRRYNHRISLARVRHRAEQLVFKPVGIPFILYICRIVFLG